jgi:hypothetical protein
MITEAIINFFINLLIGLINLFPVFGLDSDLLGGVSKVVVLFDRFSYVVPVQSFINCAVIVILFSNTQFLMWVVNWIIRRVSDIIP